MNTYKFHIGLRTIKTAIAVVIAMLIVDVYGTTTSRLTFAMLGAMNAVQPTFKQSVESFLTQIIGVFLGALAGIGFLMLPISPVVAAGLAVILVITLYNLFHIEYSPSLPSLIIVTICITPDIQPIGYALGRFWDTMIGLSVGMLINVLVFPYNNSQRIRSAISSLEKELIVFLEEMFDGDSELPNTLTMVDRVKDIERQLSIFSKQWLLLQQKKNRNQLQSFQRCERRAKRLVAHMEVLCRMEEHGTLTYDNYVDLMECGANILEQYKQEDITDIDIITNYHVSEILSLRKELLTILRN